MPALLLLPAALTLPPALLTLPPLVPLPAVAVTLPPAPATGGCGTTQTALLQIWPLRHSALVEQAAGGDESSPQPPSWLATNAKIKTEGARRRVLLCMLDR